MVVGRVTGVAIAMLALACSSSSSSGGGDGGNGGVSAAQACNDRATAYCSRLAACSAQRIQTAWGDQATCVSRTVANCTASLSAASTGSTPETAEACAAAYPTWDCGDFLSDQNIPAGCAQASGTLPAGGTCATPGQCTTGYCAITPGSLCGVCATPPTAGQSCAALTTCGPGLDCTTDTQTCVVEGASGATCGKGAPCAALFSCMGANNTKGVTGTCQTSLTQPGATCDPNQQTTAACDRNALLTCNTQSKQCATLSVAPAGQPCGTNDVADQTVLCSTNGTCTGATTGTPGTCTAAAADGAACDLVNGPGCLQLSRCIATGDGGTAGTCQMVNPSACP